jgi:hypothetical protein
MRGMQGSRDEVEVEGEERSQSDKARVDSVLNVERWISFFFMLGLC